MLKRNLETFLGCTAEYGEAKLVLFGAPFDSTTSFRPGARFGPRAMRGDSWGLETYSPYQDKELPENKVFDAGDPELPFGAPERALDRIGETAGQILADGKLPVMMGGEHLVTLGALRAAANRYPELHILHFDAHADLREQYLGEPLSHACVLRRCWETVGDGRIFQFGIRSGEREEFVWGEEHVYTRKFDFEGLADVTARLSGKPVYLTVDLDVLDPSVLPGTGTPEPGGASFSELLGAILSLKGLNIVAADVCELAPMLDPSGASAAAACKLLRELLILL
ncbi:agmatinase [Papillibacter cinnamivorans]|uniref:Agmatinase n=1 Tax=Papillibacter cinnamivorans DSM 12816 TaxID=1122930 RepID=A0A1W2C988_9FIRM|nr:agmatinase [Papillibacter cinnamivorans]SMC81739.1 agmatinase [Papillibacter cinnamivorans DSM 12816]